MTTFLLETFLLGFSAGAFFGIFFVKLYLRKTKAYPQGIWDIRIRRWWRGKS